MTEHAPEACEARLRLRGLKGLMTAIRFTAA